MTETESSTSQIAAAVELPPGENNFEDSNNHAMDVVKGTIVTRSSTSPFAVRPSWSRRQTTTLATSPLRMAVINSFQPGRSIDLPVKVSRYQATAAAVAPARAPRRLLNRVEEHPQVLGGPELHQELVPDLQRLVEQDAKPVERTVDDIRRDEFPVFARPAG